MRKTTGPRKVGVMGRWSIFRDKSKGQRVQGRLTEAGGQYFERNRAQLASIYRAIMGRAAVTISDADTVEFLARGELETRRYLRMMKRREVLEQQQPA